MSTGYERECELRQAVADAERELLAAETAWTIARVELASHLNPGACRTSVACVMRNGCRKCIT